MAQVTVFVDDAVRGELPLVCAKDGVATADRLIVRSTVGDGARIGVLWLLLLAGPFGWLALLVIISSRSGGAEVLTTELPMSEGAYHRVLGARRTTRRGWMLIGGGLLILLSVAARGSLIEVVPEGVRGATGFALVVLGVFAAMRGDRQRSRAIVHVHLDASRRWVTLDQVHPAFRAACEAHQRERQHLRR